MDKVDQYLEKWARDDAPGLALAVVKDGEVVLRRHYGLANLDYAILITSKTVFRVASLAKQFTAACIGLLIHQGRLTLQDKVRDWIPELPDSYFAVAIKHLLWHTSGIQDYPHLVWGLMGKSFGDAVTPQAVLGLLTQLDLDFTPGTKHQYNNAGYFLMGIIVERVTGQSLAEFARENIFTPLGMYSTHFHDDYSRIVSNRAVGYRPLQSGFAVFDIPTCTLVGDDGLFTTLDDMLVWEQFFYQRKLGNLAATMIERGKLDTGEPVNYGHGLFIQQRDGLDMFWHHGENLGNQSVFRSYPQHNLSIICLANTSELNPIRLVNDLENILLDRPTYLKGTPQNPIIGHEEIDLSQFEGFYCNREIALLIETAVKDGCFQMVINNKYSYELEFVTENKAVAKVFSGLGLEFLSQGKVVFFEGEDRFLLEGMPKGVVPPSNLAEFTGEYYNSALDTTWIVEKATELLLVNKDKNRQCAGPLEHIFEDFYSAQFNLWSREVHFKRQNGEVVAMVIFNGDSAPIRFDKI